MENIVNVTVDLSKLSEKQLEQLMFIADDSDPLFFDDLEEEVKERLKDGRIIYNFNPDRIPSDWDNFVAGAKYELELEEE